MHPLGLQGLNFQQQGGGGLQQGFGGQGAAHCFGLQAGFGGQGFGDSGFGAGQGFASGFGQGAGQDGLGSTFWLGAHCPAGFIVLSAAPEITHNPITRMEKTFLNILYLF